MDFSFFPFGPSELCRDPRYLSGGISDRQVRVLHMPSGNVKKAWEDGRVRWMKKKTSPQKGSVLRVDFKIVLEVCEAIGT